MTNNVTVFFKETAGRLIKSAGIINLIFCVTLIAGGVLTAMSTSWFAQNLARAEAEREATHWQNRIIELLDNGIDTFSLRKISENDVAKLQTFMQDTSSFRYVLFDKDGVAFASSLKRRIGSRADLKAQKLVFQKGEILHLISTKKVNEIDDRKSQKYRMHEDKKRIVSEIYIPVIKDGQIIGAIEHYRDDTEAIEWAEQSLDVIAFIASCFVTAIAAFILFTLWSSAKRREEALSEAHQIEVRALEKQASQSREQRLLSELNDWLQSSASLEELFDMVSAFMTKLFPDNPGTINVYSNSRDVLEHACSWSEGTAAEQVSPHDCWGLRRGRAYTFGQNEVDFVCSHVGDLKDTKYVCIPVVAHGETVGLMHLREGADKEENFEEKKRLAILCAEHISLAIANVRLRDQLHAQSIRDPLTGLYNRRYFQDACRRLIERADSNDTPFSLISIDIDHFKRFNDNHGHDAGDTVLRTVGEAIENECGPSDFPARLGGEEFVVVAQADVIETSTLAENLRLAVEKISVKYGSSVLPTISISLGVAMFPNDGNTPLSLLKSSDAALYEAKSAGRNCVKYAVGAAHEIERNQDKAIDELKEIAQTAATDISEKKQAVNQ